MTTAALIAGWMVAALGAGGSVVALLKVGAERKKITAEAYRAGVDSAQVLSNTAMSLLQPALEQVAFLRTELADARAEITSLRAEIAELRHGLVT